MLQNANFTKLRIYQRKLCFNSLNPGQRQDNVSWRNSYTP